MATPRNESYTVASGGSLYVGRPAPASVPEWLAGKPLNTWFNAPNSNIVGLATDAGTVGAAIMNDYSGTVIADGHLYAFGGGHGGQTDNTVARYNLHTGMGWEVFCQPTPVAQRNFAVTGDTALEKFWWGDAGSLKPNPPHTYSSGQWVPALNRIIWFGQRGPYNYSGANSQDRLLQLGMSTAQWTQPDSPDDVKLPVMGRCTVQLPSGLIIGSSGGTTIYQYDPTRPKDERFSTWTQNGALNWNGYGQYMFDQERNRLIRLGNGYGTVGSNNLYTIDMTTKTVASVRSLVTGDPAHLSAFDLLCAGDTVGCCLDPLNDRIIVPTRLVGGSFYAIDLATWAMTLESPSVQSDSTVSAAPGTGGIFGRIHYVDEWKTLLFNPNGSAPLCAMRLG